jgi:hypothetical protein
LKERKEKNAEEKEREKYYPTNGYASKEVE